MSDGYFSSFQQPCFLIGCEGRGLSSRDEALSAEAARGGETRRIDENKPLNHTKKGADDPAGVKVDAAKVTAPKASLLLCLWMFNDRDDTKPPSGDSIQRQHRCNCCGGSN